MATASEIVALADAGISNLAHAYGISRRQAEQFAVQAKRVLNLGADPVMVPGDAVGTVRAAQQPSEPLETPTVDPEEQAQAEARRIRALQPSNRMAAKGEIAGRIATLSRNVEAGYYEWEPELKQLRRVLEILEGVSV